MNIFELLKSVQHELGIHNFQDISDSGERWFLSNCLGKKKSPVVFDVGANVGDYTKEVLKACPSAKVFAFEPNPESFRILKKNFKGKGLKAFDFGLSDKPGKAKIFDRKDLQGEGFTTLYRDVIEVLHHADALEYEVELDTLDAFMEREKIERIHFLKIDAEGHDLKILKGGKKAIKKGLIDVIQFEFNEMNVISRVFLKDFMDLLDGYRFFRLLPKGLFEITEYKPGFCEVFTYQNIICVRDDITAFDKVAEKTLKHMQGDAKKVGNFDVLERAVADFNTRFGEINNVIGRVIDRESQLLKERTSIKEELTSVKKEMGASKAKRAALQKQVEAEKGSVQYYKAELEAVNREAGAWNYNCKSAEKKRDEAIKNWMDLQEELRSSHETVTELRSQLSGSKSKATASQKEKDRIQSELDASAAELSEMKAEHQATQQKLSDSETLNKQKTAEMASLHGDYDDMRGKLKSAQDDISRLGTELSITKEHIGNMEQSVFWKLRAIVNKAFGR